ncbi:DivIVA domain-containing protein [Candidatus Nitronereus thalassa]|uniref:DivIVA domain-containing protein n=1 Tax=Candidatus Nitronereus thalassa TaxID=3020898 RepID=A0ABU3KAB3_9BACT|nr:DivIVA domain-containing protein [Candidatus Nitronereus thalassa]MDT7043353.1 DivIVA domain-containing protein [Candidatus Nitronereus thalassa]
MRITPLDIQQKEFPKKFRGYDPEQVNAFLETVSQTVESLVRENASYREKIVTREHELAELRKSESTLTNTLISTQNFADQLKVNAQQDADRIIREAELQAEERLAAAREELADLHRSIADVRRQRIVAVEQIRSTIHTIERLIDVEVHEAGPPLEPMNLPRAHEETAPSSY